MPQHDYTAKQALDLLFQKIETKSPELAARMRNAVDAGKDIEMETDKFAGRGKNKHYYRKNVPFTSDEALKAALDVLQSHLLESRMLVNAAHEQFKQVGLAPPRKNEPLPEKDFEKQLSLSIKMTVTPLLEEIVDRSKPKNIEVEVETETVQEKRNLPDLEFIPLDDKTLHSLRQTIEKLKMLTEFGDKLYGHPR